MLAEQLPSKMMGTVLWGRVEGKSLPSMNQRRTKVREKEE